jgi:hypothetical protein
MLLILLILKKGSLLSLIIFAGSLLLKLGFLFEITLSWDFISDPPVSLVETEGKTGKGG